MDTAVYGLGSGAILEWRSAVGAGFYETLSAVSKDASVSGTFLSLLIADG